MEIKDFTDGKFMLSGGMIYDAGVKLCELPDKPIKEAGGDAVYLIENAGIYRCLVVIYSASGRYKNQILPALECEHDLYKVNVFLPEGKRLFITKFGPYEYPHEDSDMTFLVITPIQG